MIIKNAQYHKTPRYRGNVSIPVATFSYEWGSSWSVPLDPNNRHYAEILRQVKEGTLTIKDAD